MSSDRQYDAGPAEQQLVPPASPTSTDAPDDTEQDRPARTEVDGDDTGPAEPGTGSRGAGTTTTVRVVVAAVAVLAVLLLGAALGMLIQLPGARQSTTPAAGSVDVGFAQDMSVHHLQAVTMAGWAREHSTDPVIKQLAFDIERSQLEQVGRMRGWLSMWNQPEIPTGGYMAWMTGPESGHHGGAPTGQGGAVTTMPGMASQKELARLRSLSGRELDVYFLQLMIRHHQGGKHMMEYAAQHATQPALRNLAQRMLDTQEAETHTMLSLLTERGGEPLPLS